MTNYIFVVAAVLLVACSKELPTEGNAVAIANTASTAETAAECVPPTLAMADNAKLQSALMDETGANFATAYKSACAKNLLSGRPLFDPKATDQKQIFLINAPEANVASIYLSDVDGSRMVLEYPFLTTDGKSQVPSTDELEEAIFCSVVGATPEEEESSGRCLVD